jgi:hypothetical protein
MKIHNYHIERQRKKFYKYLRKEILGKNYAKYVDDIAKRTNIYVFSGVIRDFFIQRYDRRDLDLVLEDFPEGFLGDFESDPNFVSEDINKFGGVKLVMKDLIIDIWRLKDTWGIKKKKLDDNYAGSLTKTSFFNFSSIVFDYKQIQFLDYEKFEDFLNNRIMDVVYSHNIDNACCIVSALHYRKFYNFGISEKLARWLRDKYNPKMDFKTVQIRRFGNVEFSPEEIKELILNEI